MVFKLCVTNRHVPDPKFLSGQAGHRTRTFACPGTGPDPVLAGLTGLKIKLPFLSPKKALQRLSTKKIRRESSQTSFAHSSLILDPPRHWIGSYFTPRIRMKIVFFGTTPDVFRYNRQTNICSFQRNCSCGYLVPLLVLPALGLLLTASRIIPHYIIIIITLQTKIYFIKSRSHRYAIGDFNTFWVSMCSCNMAHSHILWLETGINTKAQKESF